MPFSELDRVAGEATALAELFVQAGHRVYLVGGIVRDLWLDRPIGDDLDLDLTTDARPEQTRALVAPLAEALWLQGERFGTIGAQVDGRAYEITTHRSERYENSSRKPDVAFATAIDEDLSRRDFTVNAMAVELPGADLVDPFGGADDLAAGVLRTPLDPAVSFTDDPLRMLRAARFAAGYGLEPQAELVEAMARLAERLDIVSVERIGDELDKLLSLPTPSAGLGLLASTGLLGRVLPEAVAAPVVGRGQGAVDFGRVDALVADPALRLASLLVDHDVSVAKTRLRALRYGNERTAVIGRLVAGARAVWHDPPVEAPAYRRWHRSVGSELDGALALVRVVDPSNDATVDAVAAMGASLADELAQPGPPIDGARAMAVLGLTEGPDVGRAMAHLQALRDDLGPFSAEEAEQHLRDWWADPGTSERVR